MKVRLLIDLDVEGPGEDNAAENLRWFIVNELENSAKDFDFTFEGFVEELTGTPDRIN